MTFWCPALTSWHPKGHRLPPLPLNNKNGLAVFSTIWLWGSIPWVFHETEIQIERLQMQAHEIMDCQDLVNEIDYMAQFLRSDHVYEDYADFDAMAKDLDEAANKLTNLVERLRLL
jgi:hypothetical protein